MDDIDTVKHVCCHVELIDEILELIDLMEKGMVGGFDVLEMMAVVVVVRKICMANPSS